MPDNELLTLYKPCFLCNQSMTIDSSLREMDLTPRDDCQVCHGRRFIPHGQVMQCEDHEVLDILKHTLDQLPAYRSRGVSRESECVEFVCPIDGRKFEVIVREIGDGDDWSDNDEDSSDA